MNDNNTFNIQVTAAGTPACGPECPLLVLKSESLYADDKQVLRVWFCKNRSVCTAIHDKIKEAVSDE